MDCIGFFSITVSSQYCIGNWKRLKPNNCEYEHAWVQASPRLIYIKILIIKLLFQVCCPGLVQYITKRMSWASISNQLQMLLLIVAYSTSDFPSLSQLEMSYLLSTTAVCSPPVPLCCSLRVFRIAGKRASYNRICKVCYNGNAMSV